MKKLLLATALVLAATAAHAQGTESELKELYARCAKVPKHTQAFVECLYGTTDHEFFNAFDRYAQMRSVEEYRRIVPNEYDLGGFCRGAEHLRECLVAMNAMLDRQDTSQPVDPADAEYARTVEKLEHGDTPYDPSKSGWVKSADVARNILDECDLVDNYTDAHKKGEQCAMFAIPVFDRPHGKIVGSLVVDTLVKTDSKRRGFTHVKSDGISSDVFDFSECG
jgi:hypothetical protein